MVTSSWLIWWVLKQSQVSSWEGAARKGEDGIAIEAEIGARWSPSRNTSNRQNPESGPELRRWAQSANALMWPRKSDFRLPAPGIVGRWSLIVLSYHVCGNMWRLPLEANAVWMFYPFTLYTQVVSLHIHIRVGRQVEWPLSEMTKTRSVSSFTIFWISYICFRASTYSGIA